MPISGGKFGFKGKFNLDNGSVVVAHNVHGTIAGVFGANHTATGTMKFHWKFDSHAPNGFAGYKCTTGTVQFTAQHT
jgi:hypothetical protein